MKIQYKPILAYALVFIASVQQIHAQSVAIGSQAPKLQTTRWVKGSAITEFKNGRIYVVDLWATWCIPCVERIPRLTELQKKYESDVTIIGLDIGEQEHGALESFVQKMGDKMNYAVAMTKINTDAQSSDAIDTWMKPAGIDAIPAAFVIDRDGKIAWIGNPVDLDGPLESIVKGTFDRSSFKEKYEAVQHKKEEQKATAAKYNDALKKAFEAKDWEKALQVADEYQKATGEPSIGSRWRTKVFESIGDLSKVQAYVNETLRKTSDALSAYASGVKPSDSGGVSSALDALNEIDKSIANQASLARIQRLKIYFVSGDIDSFTKYAEQMVSGTAKDDSEFLNKVAWYIAGPCDVETNKTFFYYIDTPCPKGFNRQPLLPLAKKASERAVELTKRGHGGYLDSMAWVQFRLGNKAEAAKIEREASLKPDAVKEFYEMVAKKFDGTFKNPGG